MTRVDPRARSRDAGRAVRGTRPSLPALHARDPEARSAVASQFPHKSVAAFVLSDSPADNDAPQDVLPPSQLADARSATRRFRPQSGRSADVLASFASAHRSAQTKR